MNTSDTPSNNQNSIEPAQETSNTSDNTGQWYYLVGEKTCGPSTTEQIRNFIASGALSNATYVFRDGMNDWTKAYALPQFQRCGDTVTIFQAAGEPSSPPEKPKTTTSRGPWAWPVLSLLVLMFLGVTIGVTTMVRHAKLEKAALIARQQQEQAAIEAKRQAEEAARIAKERAAQEQQKLAEAEAAHQAQETARNRETPEPPKLLKANLQRIYNMARGINASIASKMDDDGIPGIRLSWGVWGAQLVGAPQQLMAIHEVTFISNGSDEESVSSGAFIGLANIVAPGADTWVADTLRRVAEARRQGTVPLLVHQEGDVYSDHWHAPTGADLELTINCKTRGLTALQMTITAY